MASTYSIDVEIDEKWLHNQIKELFYKKEGKDYTISFIDMYSTNRGTNVSIYFKGLGDNIYVQTTLGSFVDKNGKFEIVMTDFDLIED